MPDTGAEKPITELLRKSQEGDTQALAQLMPLLYDELKGMARSQRWKGPASETLNTTALVHEAYIKLADGQGEWESRCHFLGVAAKAMRHLAVDYARRQRAAKRGGGAMPLTVDRLAIPAAHAAESVLAVDEALGELSELSPRLARVVECRFFGGMTEEETAAVVGTTDRTVRRDWIKAKAWLHRHLVGP
jgi:RNA polymerase sigma factor (TIGR02999 family)